MVWIFYRRFSSHEEKNYDLTRQVDGKVLYVNGEVRRTRDHVLGQIHHTQSYVFLLNRTKHETFAQSAEEDTQNPTRPAPPVRTLTVTPGRTTACISRDGTNVCADVMEAPRNAW